MKSATLYLFIFLLPVQLFSQTLFGQIKKQLEEGQGYNLVSASSMIVNVVSHEDNRTTKAYTNTEGFYRFQELKPGYYSIFVSNSNGKASNQIVFYFKGSGKENLDLTLKNGVLIAPKALIIEKEKTLSIEGEASPIKGLFNRNRNQIYNFSLWIKGNSKELDQIQKVEYFFNHESFKNPKVNSIDRSNSFYASYRGWGCLTSIVVTITYKDNTHAQREFNMCEYLNW